MIAVELGQVVATRSVSEWSGESITRTLAVIEVVERHGRGDWGVVDDVDASTNDRAAACGDRVVSAYDVHGKRLWVITEHDRSVTTVLFPEEY
jgi:hypothetical protein